MTNAHAIKIGPFGGLVRVRVGGEMIANTAHALLLEEGSLPPVFYIPRGDVHMDRLTPSATTSHCPFKGDAVYFSVAGGPADVAWSYETPLGRRRGDRRPSRFLSGQGRDRDPAVRLAASGLLVIPANAGIQFGVGAGFPHSRMTERGVARLNAATAYSFFEAIQSSIFFSSTASGRAPVIST